MKSEIVNYIGVVTVTASFFILILLLFLKSKSHFKQLEMRIGKEGVKTSYKQSQSSTSRTTSLAPSNSDKIKRGYSQKTKSHAL
jgi:hypothetical protein